MRSWLDADVLPPVPCGPTPLWFFVSLFPSPLWLADSSRARSSARSSHCSRSTTSARDVGWAAGKTLTRQLPKVPMSGFWEDRRVFFGGNTLVCSTWSGAGIVDDRTTGEGPMPGLPRLLRWLAPVPPSVDVSRVTESGKGLGSVAGAARGLSRRSGEIRGDQGRSRERFERMRGEDEWG